MRRSAPYAELERADFDAVVELVSEGITTGRGKRMAYVHRDGVNGVLRPRRGARLAALTSGGAIAEVGDYRVVADPDDTPVGTVNEDFAIESMVGDVFLLGTHSWRIRRVTQGEVRVTDAEGAHPTIPFWVGEAPSRTEELSEEVSVLRRTPWASSSPMPSDGDRAPPAASTRPGRMSSRRAGSRPTRPSSWSQYLAAGLGELGIAAHRRRHRVRAVLRRGGRHADGGARPLGGRINRGLGLALRKRFCATFDFELQAAANDDSVVLSLGPQHSFPLDSAPRLLRSETAEGVLRQAVLASPMFAGRWRWNLNRSLAVLRFRGGKKNPLPIQRMEADDLMAAVFPALAACQENAPGGPVVIPDHVLVRQTLLDCLHEAMDVDGLVALLRAHGGGDGPRPLRRLDRAVGAGPRDPERQALHLPRRRPPRRAPHPAPSSCAGACPCTPKPSAQLDPAALERVRAEAAPDVRGPEELHDLLLSAVVWRPQRRTTRPGSTTLADSGRATPRRRRRPRRRRSGADSRAVVRHRAPAVGRGGLPRRRVPPRSPSPTPGRRRTDARPRRGGRPRPCGAIST